MRQIREQQEMVSDLYRENLALVRPAVWNGHSAGSTNSSTEFKLIKVVGTALTAILPTIDKFFDIAPVS
jgi:hypothetical protein